MLQLLSFLFLAVVFVCSLIYPILSTVPPEKLLAWIKSLLIIPPTMSTTTTASASTKEEKKEKNKSTHDKVELERVFATFDKNGDGFITKKELWESLKNMGLLATEEEVATMVAGLDANGDGLIDLDEFCGLYDSMMQRSQGIKIDGMEKEVEDDDDDDLERDLREAFDVFDGNGDGLITVDELGLVLSSMGLKQGIGVQDCREMIKMVDMDGDGMVDFDEFKKMMMKKPSPSAPATGSTPASSS